MIFLSKIARRLINLPVGWVKGPFSISKYIENISKNMIQDADLLVGQKQQGYCMSHGRNGVVLHPFIDFVFHPD